MSRKIKAIALQTIVLSMEEIKQNLTTSALNEDVKANAEAMKILADAFASVEKNR